MLVTYRQAFSNRDDPRADTLRTELVRLLTAMGDLQRDSVVEVRSQQFIVERVGRGLSVTLNPFGRRSIVRAGPGDRVYHLWTESAAVEGISLRGDRVEHAVVAHQAPPVTG